MAQTLKASDPIRESPSRGGRQLRIQRPVLYLATGGSGVLTGTYLDALFRGRLGVVPDGVAFLGFDVMESPPAVMISPASADSMSHQVRLEPGVEYCQIGRDCDPARLSSTLNNGSGSDHDNGLRRLIERQPGGRLVKSIQTGTQGERLYGLLGFTWSLADIRRLLTSTLRRLNDLRLSGNGDDGAGIALQVVIVGSTAGGVGSATMLPLCGEVKRAMHQLGMDVNRSTFVAVCYMPDAFPETQLRLSNAFDSLNDFTIAQKEGVTPNDSDHSFGQPFDLLLLCGSQTESGRNLKDIRELAPVVASALFVLGNTPLRDDASALTNNALPVLNEVTADGELTDCGSVGIVEWTFPGPDIATYFAHIDALELLGLWQQKPETAELKQRLGAVGHARRLGDLVEFMEFVQETGGDPQPGAYGKEVSRSLRGRRVKAKTLPAEIRVFEDAFEDRIREAVAGARTCAADTASGYVSAVSGESCRLSDEHGFFAGFFFVEEAVSHIKALQGVLETQRDEIGEELRAAQAETERCFSVFEAAVKSRIGWLKGGRKYLRNYLSAAEIYYQRRHAHDLTEAALAALAQAQGDLMTVRLKLLTMLSTLRLVSERCRRSIEDFESRVVTPVSEIISRPLYSTSQLHRLYREVHGVPCGSVSKETEAAVRQALGPLSDCIGADQETIYRELIDSLQVVHRRTAMMTADDYLRWLCELGEVEPALFVRDSEALAPVLCRYDRARLPDSRSLEETTFRLVGVPDRDSSVLSAVTDSLLVSTGDSERITFVVLKLGFPASALWHYDRYRAAQNEVRRKGRVAHEIYPNFPYPGGDNGRGRKHRR